MDVSEMYIKAINIEYDSADVIFTRFVVLKTPQFNLVKGSAYGKGTNYLKEIVEYIGQNCTIPISAMCFLRCTIYFTNKDFTEEFRDLI